MEANKPSPICGSGGSQGQLAALALPLPPSKEGDTSRVSLGGRQDVPPRCVVELRSHGLPMRPTSNHAGGVKPAEQLGSCAEALQA